MKQRTPNLTNNQSSEGIELRTVQKLHFHLVHHSKSPSEPVDCDTFHVGTFRKIRKADASCGTDAFLCQISISKQDEVGREISHISVDCEMLSEQIDKVGMTTEPTLFPRICLASGGGLVERTSHSPCYQCRRYGLHPSELAFHEKFSCSVTRKRSVARA